MRHLGCHDLDQKPTGNPLRSCHDKGIVAATDRGPERDKAGVASSNQKATYRAVATWVATPNVSRP
ncbi:hypothetical protein Taro_030009 [Colocasia esculenta]|uniref:Uncharacterized protein n=1 Tax=Colocasia esculenta TaxID=4460 RepID=A0A843VSV0_COLES|nr:hypothetical protein [Colocasia esculenta]